MKKLSKIFIVFIACFSIFISVSYFNNTTTARAEDISGDFVMPLPSIDLNIPNKGKCSLPTIFLCFSSYELECYLYTLDGLGNANKWNYKRRDYEYSNTTLTTITWQSLTWSPMYYYIGSTQPNAVTWGTAPCLFNITRYTDYSIDTVVDIYYEVYPNGIQYSLFNYNGRLLCTIILEFASLDNAYSYTGTAIASYIINSGYDVSSYELGYRNGYLYGKNVGFDEGVNSTQEFNFKTLIGAVIDVPINAFKSLLNFNFLDINILDFVLSILTFVIVLKVIGLITGG